MHEKILSPLMVRTLAYTKEQPVGDGNVTVTITICGWQMYHHPNGQMSPFQLANDCLYDMID